MTDKPRRRAWFARIRWPLFLAGLAGLAVELHIELPPLPRWSIRRLNTQGMVSTDGKTLVTCARHVTHCKGPLETWDTSTGQLMATIPENSPLFFDWKNSRYNRWLGETFGESRYFAVVLDDRRVALGDIQTGREWTITLPTSKPADFPPQEKWLKPADTWMPLREHFVFQEGPDSASNPVKYHVVEASTGELVATLSAFSSPDQKCHFIGDSHVKEDDLILFFAPAKKGPLLTVWSLKERQIIQTFPSVQSTQLRPSCYLTADGKEILMSNRIGNGDGGEFRWDVWNLRTGGCRSFTGSGEGVPQVSLDGLIFAFPRHETIELWRGQNLQKRTTLPTEQWDLNPLLPLQHTQIKFCRGSRFISAYVPGKPGSFYLWNSESGERLWEKNSTKIPSDYCFSPDSEFVMFCKSDELKMEILEVASGNVHWTISRTQPGAIQWSNEFLTAGEYVAYGGYCVWRREPNLIDECMGTWSPFKRTLCWKGVVVVGHIPTRKEIVRLHTDWDLRLHYLSPDGLTLITSCGESSSEEVVYQAWDLPLRPRWGWVLGVPAGLLAIVLLMKWMLAWRKRGAFRGTPIPTPMP